MINYKEWGEGELGIKNIAEHERVMIKVLCQQFIEEG